MNEMSDLFSSIQDGKNRLAALYRVSQSLGTSLDLHEVLNQVMDSVIELTGAERGFLMLQNPDTGDLDLMAARNMEGVSLERREMEVSRTVIQSVLREGKGVILTDAQRDPRFAGQDSIILYALRSIMCAPLRARGQIIGAVYVDNRAQSGVFRQEDLDLLNAFANQAAIAIENARLYTRTDEALNARVAELETLSKIDRDLNAQLDLQKVIEMIYAWAESGAGAKRCLLIRRSQEGELLAWSGQEEVALRTLDESLEPLVLQVLKEEAPLAIPSQAGAPTRLLVPMCCARHTEYVLVAEASEPFSEAAKNFLVRLSGRAAAALQNARLFQAVQDANQAKSKFVSVVTHELRIPMTSIKGYTDLLRQGAVGPLNEMQQNFLGVIRNNVERMSTLVSDLSDISHLETGRMQLKCEFVHLRQYVDETLKNLAQRLEEKQQNLEVDIPDDLPAVYADANRLVQVLTNLISNANKYTPNGGEIKVCAHAEDDCVRVEVMDNGIGIGPEDQQNLFSQFFRSENPAVREQQGWGLGLNLTKRLVALMGGEIGAKSVLGQGSTFWFTLLTKQPPSQVL